MPEKTPVIWCYICTWHATPDPALWTGIAAKGVTHHLCSACKDRYRSHYTRIRPLLPRERVDMTTPPSILQETE